MYLAGEEWAARFEGFQREAWRLETLPQYLMPQEEEEFAALKPGPVSTLTPSRTSTPIDCVDKSQRGAHKGVCTS